MTHPMASAKTPIVTLLGTGTPIPDPHRHGPSQVIELGEDTVLIDCGAGALHRFLESGLDVNRISHILLTHLHSDHVSALNDFLWAGWVGRWWKDRPPLLCGPPGTKEFAERLFHAFEEDIRLRSDEGAVSVSDLKLPVIEVENNWTNTRTNWKLTAFRVEHLPVKHAFGFKFEYPGKSVVISGDTTRCENLIQHARNADLLIHEVAWGKGMMLAIDRSEGADRARFERILNYHTSALDVGEICSLANVKHVVLTHLMLAGGTPADLVNDVRKSFDGKITVGHDLAKFTV